MLARRVRDALLLGLVFGGLSGTFAARAAQEVRAYAVAFYAEEKTATGGTVSAAKEFSSADGSGTASARSSATFGILRAYSEAHAANTGSASSARQGGAQAAFKDTLTINAPGLTGTSGELTVRFKIDGSLTCSGGGDQTRQSYATATYELRKNDSPLVTESQWVYYDGTTSGTAFLGTQRTATIPFTFGTPFDLELFIETTAQAYHFRGADAMSDMGNTATWGGFASVKDAGGNDVQGYTAVSSSGSNYVEPITPPAPKLDLVQSGSALMAQWSTNFPGYVLESSTQMPSANWTAVTNAVSTVSNQFVVPLTNDVSQRYFRLKK